MAENEVISLGKVRADRTGSGENWSPREALMEMLRLLDAGLCIDKMIICYDGIDGASFQNATKSVLEAIGLLQVTQMTVYSAGRDEGC